MGPHFPHCCKNANTVISVITCEGQDCQLDTIGTCADITSGRVDVVDPTKMDVAMKHALGPATVASNVRIALYGPCGCVLSADWHDASSIPSKAIESILNKAHESAKRHDSINAVSGAEVATAALGCVTEDRTLTCAFDCPSDIFGGDNET